MAKSSTPSTARSGLPTWLKVTTIAILVAANLGVLAYIWLISTGNSVLEGADTDDEVSEVLDQSTGDSLNFLIVGSDSREGLESLENFGAAGGARGDVIILVRLDQSTSRAQMLSIPRDLLVQIPGHGQRKINASYALGGPALLVDTIKANLDVEVNHYVEIDFVGFQALVDELGGIEIAFPYAARDSKSGLDVQAGSQTLDGAQALAYARSRRYQENQNGSWVSVEANDIGRTGRQQEVIRAILAELKSPATIADAGDIASTMAQHMTIDSRLAELSVGSMLWDYKGILTGDVEGATLPSRTSTVGGASVQLMVEPDATNMLANFRAGNPFAAQPLRLTVLNGNGSAGAAGEMARELEALGFKVESIGNAGSDGYQETTIVVPEGSVDGAEIRSALGFGLVTFGSVDNGYDAIVIVGSDAS